MIYFLKVKLKRCVNTKRLPEPKNYTFGLLLKSDISVSFCIPSGSVGLRYLQNHLAIKYRPQRGTKCKKKLEIATLPSSGRRSEGVVCTVLSVILTAGGANRHIQHRFNAQSVMPFISMRRKPVKNVTPRCRSSVSRSRLCVCLLARCAPIRA
jgi:hypothetical protein